MVDVVDKRTRSRMMAGIRGVNTKPELLLRRALHAAGFRYRLYLKDLPGKPDMVFPRYGAVIFVHGCFWHCHAGCKWAARPASNVEFWIQKLNRNVERDAQNVDGLRRLGWRVGQVWECAMRLQPIEEIAESVGMWLLSSNPSLTLPRRPLGRLPQK
jgi:DNA mismatch endonuclease (patch repair protein)